MKRLLLSMFVLSCLGGAAYGQRYNARCGCQVPQEQRVAMGRIGPWAWEAYQVWRSPEGRIARQAAGATWRNYQMMRRAEAEARRREVERTRESYMNRMASRAYAGGWPNPAFGLVRNLYPGPSTRVREAEARSSQAADRAREAYDRYRESARSLRDPSQSVRAFREGVQALRDYGRAMNDRLNADREAREARGQAAREVKDWRDQARERFDSKP